MHPIESSYLAFLKYENGQKRYVIVRTYHSESSSSFPWTATDAKGAPGYGKTEKDALDEWTSDRSVESLYSIQDLLRFLERKESRPSEAVRPAPAARFPSLRHNRDDGLHPFSATAKCPKCGAARTRSAPDHESAPAPITFVHDPPRWWQPERADRLRCRCHRCRAVYFTQVKTGESPP